MWHHEGKPCLKMAYDYFLLCSKNECAISFLHEENEDYVAET